MADAQNRLIELLPKAVCRQLLEMARPVELRMSQVLFEAGEAMLHAYFPVNAFVSLIVKVDDQPGVEVGMVGREGFVGAPLVLGSGIAVSCAIVQGGGLAWQIEAADLRRMLSKSEVLKRHLDNYVHVLMSQQANAAACLRFHQVAPRLARWLLMSQDRSHSSTFRITHEFIAYMLGVRRAGITTAASALHRAGLIDYRRGLITVLDRPGLESASCSCYMADRATYAQTMQQGCGDVALV